MADERVAQLLREAAAMRYSRRAIVKRGAALGLSASALSGVLAASGRAAPVRRAPLFQGDKKLTILASSYFVAPAQDFYTKQAQDWGKQNGVEVTTDYVNWPDLQPRIAAAVEGGSGPDIIEMWDTWPFLYVENMVPMDDLAKTVGDTYGGYYEWVTKTASVDGKWYSVPIGASSAAYAFRISYLEEAGVTDPKKNFPKTWEELFTVGKKLKEMGKPIGQALGQSLGDPPNFAYSYMWSHGAKEVEEDGKTVAFNTPEFVDGLGAFVQGWKDAFDETGLSWDDSANNRAFLSDQISATINGSSIYITAQNAKVGTAKTDYEVVVDPSDIWHAPYPSGPAGQFNLLGSRSYAAMNYSKSQDVAKEFLTWWFQKEQFIPWLEAQKGYIIPMAPGYAENEIYTGDPALAPYPEVADYSRNKGFAGPADKKAAEAAAKYIVVNTFSKAIQGGDAKSAIEQGAKQLERVYGG